MQTKDCCIKINRHNNNYCSNRKYYTIERGDYSYLTLLAHQTNQFTAVDTGIICLNHWNQLLKNKLHKCIATFCNEGENKKSLRKCPKQFLIYFNLHETAIVNIHQHCYLKFQQELKESTSGDNNNTTQSDAINNNHAVLANITNREEEIAAHQYLSSKQTNTPPASPIKITGKRGKPSVLLPIPQSTMNYAESSHSTKYRKLQLVDSVVKQIVHNSAATEEENKQNEIGFLSDYINYNKENLIPAINQSQYRTESFQLTEDQTILLRKNLNLTWNQLRILRNYLKSRGENSNLEGKEYSVFKNVQQWTDWPIQ